MMKDLEVAIVGAGIGGLAAALELQRAGMRVTVYERRDELAEVNTGFLLWAFAIKRLNDLGLGEQLARIGEPVVRLLTTTWQGRALSHVSLEGLATRVGASSYDVHRAGLQQLLADSVGSDCIRLGRRCVRAREDQTGRPVVEFDDGERVSADFVVGADGIHSEVRTHVVGETELHPEPIGVWRGIAAVETSTIALGDHIRVMGPGSLFGGGRLDDRTVRWYAGALRLGGPERLSPEEHHDRAMRTFGDWAEPVPGVIATTEPDACLYNVVRRARPLRPWSRGCVALLGDAAHATIPTLATGGGMAIEDAAVLRECVQAHGDLRSALRAYERRRRPLATRVQRTALGFERVLAIRRPRLVRLRDQGFRPGWIQRLAIGQLMRGGRVRFG